MKTKLILVLTGSFLMMLVLGMYIFPPLPPSDKVDLKVVKVEGVWKVVDASDYNKTEVKVKKKDTITWTAEGTDAYFQFPGYLFDAVTSGDSLSNGYMKYLKDGKKLKLKVKDNAPAGTYEYAVFCSAEGVFAVGDSPPKIVIE